MGCDEPLVDKTHVLPLANGEEIELNTCPYKEMRIGKKYMHSYKWAKEGNLHYLYDPDELPASVMQAIDVIEEEISVAASKT